MSRHGRITPLACVLSFALDTCQCCPIYDLKRPNGQMVKCVYILVAKIRQMHTVLSNLSPFCPTAGHARAVCPVTPPWAPPAQDTSTLKQMLQVRGAPWPSPSRCCRCLILCLWHRQQQTQVRAQCRGLSCACQGLVFWLLHVRASQVCAWECCVCAALPEYID